jgi:hypothetical protein
MVYMHRSLGESCSGVGGPWRCRGAEEALGIVRLLCSNTLSVMLFWLGPASTRCTFSRLHGGESIRLEGLTSGPGSPEPLKPSGGFDPLCHVPVHDPVSGAVDSAAHAGQRRGGPEP